MPVVDFSAPPRTFVVAGYATNKKGKRSIRCANTEKAKYYVPVLRHFDYTEIELFDLPKPMTRVEAKAYVDKLLFQREHQNEKDPVEAA